MNTTSKFNVVVIGVSCFDGMASSMRVRNLLKASAFENSITLNNLIYKNDSHGLVQKRGILNDINYLVVSASNVFSVFSFTWKTMRFLRKSKSISKKNIIYNYQYIDIKNLFPLIYARAIGYKIILDIVEDNALYTKFAGLKNRLKIATSLWLLKLSPRIAHHVITISQHLKSLMLEVCQEKIPVSLIPITVDLKRFPVAEFNEPQIYKIFYGGSFGVKDGIENLIKAFGKLNQTYENIELVMTGRASENDFQKLQDYLGESSARAKVDHKGFLNDTDYYKTLNECHIFCMTRVNSKFANAGFPFKLGEFLSTGKAVITTQVGDVQHYLEDKKNALIIAPDSQEELESALLYLLSNPQLIPSLGREGRKVAESNFDTLQWRKVLLKIFGSV